jgi:hypothetical protein
MIFYHACPTEHTESILKEGLLRSKSSLWKASGGAIYLTKEKIWMNKSKDHDILIVSLPPKFREENEMWKGANGWEWIVWADIPPEYIYREES